jgi:hypothetical protein
MKRAHPTGSIQLPDPWIANRRARSAPSAHRQCQKDWRLGFLRLARGLLDGSWHSPNIRWIVIIDLNFMLSAPSHQFNSSQQLSDHGPK